MSGLGYAQHIDSLKNIKTIQWMCMKSAGFPYAQHMDFMNIHQNAWHTHTLEIYENEF